MGQCALLNSGGGTMEIFTIGANTQFYKGLATYINSKGEIKYAFFSSKYTAEFSCPWCKFNRGTKKITILKDGIYSVIAGTVDVNNDPTITQNITKEKMLNGKEFKFNSTAYGGDGFTIVKHG